MAETRKQVGDSCRSSPLPGVDLDSYCTCVVDKSVGSKSVAELKKMSEQEGQALGMKAAGECLAQQNPPAATAAAPTTEGPSEATKETGEAVEEAVDDAN
jgi:tRNA A37 methylthiotransferase MiaB